MNLHRRTELGPLWSLQLVGKSTISFLHMIKNFSLPPQTLWDLICVQSLAVEISEGQQQFLLLYNKSTPLKGEKVLKRLEDPSLVHVPLVS